jgi:uncharacterized protein YbcC (UPF0753/DUF2309 family)
MMQTMTTRTTSLQPESPLPQPSFIIALAAAEACRRIPPLWPLKSFVAVNPFLGLSNFHFIEAAAKLRRVAQGEILMSEDYYLAQIDSGKITKADLGAAWKHAAGTLPQPWAYHLEPVDLERLQIELQRTKALLPPAPVRSFADVLDHMQNTNRTAFLVDEISKWCSVYCDEGQSSWRMPWRDRPLYEAWREAALLDANPRLTGWTHFTPTIESLPTDPERCIEVALEKLRVPLGLAEDFLHRQLLSISGWSSYLQYQVREHTMRGREDKSLLGLLAVRLAYDLALLHQFIADKAVTTAWEDNLAKAQIFNPQTELLPRYLAHLALEASHQRQLMEKLKQGCRAPTPQPARKKVQAVFCIDVRSEVYRRALEAQSDSIGTLGFAGFFGMAVEYIKLGDHQGSSQCPVLLLPKYKVRESLTCSSAKEEKSVVMRLRLKKRINFAWNSFKTSAISCFSFVETMGLYFGVKLAQDGLNLARTAPPKNPRCCDLDLSAQPPLNGRDSGTAIPIPDQIDLAEGALRNMGLTSNLARLILICGHGSQTTNNPYASGLDCGACGGNAGDVNARVAATILNHPAVRSGLQERGLTIPVDTHFLAALHNTTTDEITIFDDQEFPSSHATDLTELKGWLKRASRTARQERAPSLGIETTHGNNDEAIFERSRDWSQVRPEWGLAGNAAFIVAPRKRTQGIDLKGRAFLHNYNAGLDGEGSVLELIMTAPMVVTNWINLQYFASTVNNQLFGSGNKTIHNVVGTLGVWQGNGGDLQVGLPIQSLHDGHDWRHEPLRLSVFIEATRESMNQVLQKHPTVRELVQNGWLHLFAMEDEGASFWRYATSGIWQKQE